MKKSLRVRNFALAIGLWGQNHPTLSHPERSEGSSSMAARFFTPLRKASEGFRMTEKGKP
jgi:hypothetical protein